MVIENQKLRVKPPPSPFSSLVAATTNQKEHGSEKDLQNNYNRKSLFKALTR